MKKFLSRNRKLLWRAGAVLAAVLLLFGPFKWARGECLYCGRHVERKWLLGVRWWYVITETDASPWADTVCPPNHVHKWVDYNSHERERFFGGTMIGDGQLGPVSTIYRERRGVGDEQAREWLEGFHARLGADTHKAWDYYKIEVKFRDDPKRIEAYRETIRRREQMRTNSLAK